MNKHWTRIALVLMAGIYAMRSTYWIFGGEPFQPLSLLAAAVLALVVVLFYRLPTQRGPALFVVIALSVVGFAVNALLLWVPGAAHNNPTHAAFSVACMAGWAIVALHGLSFMRTAPTR
jgi:hypothetical protein